ncbi:serine/threonine-protein kinase [Nocardioides sp. C4-1]|uniref:serine/threonine-protein kinase n=1 Tax=Nocardioides sp. C4-1 TaxID=3151851 RepID=UPI003267E2D7
MPALPRTGDHFGRYRIDRQIGRGGMGVVYGATDTSIGRTVALKVVSAGLGDAAQTAEFHRRFHREASVLAKLDSPHVIAIYDYGTHDGCPFIATQYVGGGDLGDLLRERGPMPPALALTVCAQVADALHDAHRVGVVHRDVKPTNVLLRDADDPTPHAYLCDFGIARTETDGITRAGAVAGTWSYLAPETGRGAPATPASDVYALGCLLWATLTGAPPYRGTDVEIAMAHQTAPLPQLALAGSTDELTGRIDHVLRRCLAKDPAERYPTADHARTDLLAAAGLRGGPASFGAAQRPDQAVTMAQVSLGSLPPRLSPPTPTPAPGAGRRRRTAVAFTVGCVAVLAVAGAVFAIPRLSDDTPEASPGGSTTPTPSPTPTPTPSPTPSEPPLPTRVDARGPITGDLDRDGLGDVTIGFDGQTTTWLSTGTALVQQDEPTRNPVSDDGYTSEVPGDFDGDDLLDVVQLVVDRKNGALTLAGDLSGGGTVSGSIPYRKATPFVSSADLDADGADDLVIGWVDTDKPPISFVGVPLLDGVAQKPIDLVDVPYTYGEAYFEVGDVDGDQRADIAVVHVVGDEGLARRQDLTIWRGTGTGVRRGPQRSFPGEILTDILAADVDGDDDVEVLAATPRDGTTIVEVLDVRDGAITKPRVAGAIGDTGDYGSDIGVSDVDGDGRDDLVSPVQTGRRQVRIIVAVSDGEKLVARPFATWKRDFGAESPYFSVSDRASS